MRLAGFRIVVVTLLSLAVVSAAAGPERRWEKGTLVDAGRRHNNMVGGATSETRPPANSGSYIPRSHGTPEVGTYVIETAELRLQLEAMVPVAGSEFEREISVGDPVTFALDKKSVYVKLANGREHRLRLVKKSPKTD